MANSNPIPKPAQHATHLVARTRKGIMGAFDVVESRGKLISEVLADAFLDNPLKFMDTAAKYLPKGEGMPTGGITVIINRDDVKVTLDKPVIEVDTDE